MIHRHRLLLLLFLCAAHVTGCHTAQTAIDTRPNAELQAPVVGVDSLLAKNKRIEKETEKKPALLPRLTDAIGISTPEGRARRQARKDAAATVPRSIGKGAVWAPLATDVVNAYKPRQTVAVARDSATLQVASNAVAGRGNTATQTATTQQAKDWKAVLAGPVGVTGAIVLALAGGYALYLLFPLLPRRKTKNQT